MTDDPKELIPGVSDPLPEQTRLSVFINDQTAEFARIYMGHYGVSATEMTRRAFGLLAVFEEAKNSRRIVQVCKKNGEPLYEIVIQ